VDEAMAHIRKYLHDNYRVVPRRKPVWWLFEKS
jgi:hypothetical protein